MLKTRKHKENVLMEKVMWRLMLKVFDKTDAVEL